MPFVPTPNIVMVELRCTMAGVPVENRFHVNVFHEPTPADLTNVANRVSTHVINDWIPNLPVALTIRSMHLRSLHNLNGIEADFPFPVPTNGSLVSPVLPNNVTICVSIRSGASGRSARGRLYWLGLVEGDVTESTLSGTRGGLIVDAVQAMIDGLATDGFAWTIVSYQSGGVPRPGGPVYFVAQTALLVDNTTDSQRGRLH